MLHLSEKYLDWALIHIENHGDTDIFPLPFEFKAIRHCWDNDIKPWLRSEDILQWKVRPYRRCLTPKHRYGFRISTQLDPIDAIVFTSLVAEIGRDLEASRLPKTQNIAFSYRFKPTKKGKFYDSDYNWEAFQQYCRDLVSTKEYRYVVLADIADFYPRIYSHPLENALQQCTTKANHVSAIKKMINKWNFSISYGIPVGPAASRLLAELVLDDVDRGLLSEGALHCRYVDDFRIFCKTEREAHEMLALLANTLFENHGLTLQQHKTRILPIEDFNEYYLQREESQELNSLTDKFYKILAEIGIDDLYDAIDYEDLDAGTQEEIDSLNLIDILEEHLSGGEDISLPLVRFVLGRLRQIDNENCVDLVLDKIDCIYPVFKDVICYIQDLSNLNTLKKHEIGEQLIQLIDTSLVGHLEYHRMWVFDTFTRDCDWDNEDKFVSLFNKYHDDFSQRKLILAMGRAYHQHWFKSRKRSINQFQPWLKRAFIAAASCLPGDEAQHWYRSILSNLDPLEVAITKWVKTNRF